MKKRPSVLLARMGRREIRSNWAQFLAIILIGGIAVTLFVGLLANAESFESRVDAAYEEGNMADIWVTTDSYDASDVSTIRSIVGDDGSVESRFEIAGQAGSHPVYAVITDGMPSISTPYSIVKKSDVQTSTYFAMVDTALASSNSGEDIAGSYQLGDTLSIDIDISSYSSTLSSFSKALGFDQYFYSSTNPFTGDVFTLSFPVTGVMKYPENITKASYNSSSVLLSDAAFHESFDSLLTGAMKKTLTSQEKETALNRIHEIFTEVGLFLGDGTSSYSGRLLAPNQYLVSLTDHTLASSIEKQIRASFSAKESDNLALVNDRTTMPFVLTMHNDVVQARQFTFVFPFVFFFVAILVILTTTSQLILKERTEIGTMKALGLSRGEIMRHYIGLTLTLVGIGVILGEILGPLIIPSILGKKYDILYTLPARTYVFPFLYGALAALGFLLVAAFVTFLVCRKEVSLPPSESMRPLPPKMKARSLPSKKKKAGVSLLTIKMAWRNIKIDPIKSLMVIAGVMGCTALLICGFGIEDTVYYGIDHDMALGNNAPITLAFSSSKDITSLNNDILSEDGVSDYEAMTRAMSTISDSSGTETSSYVYILGRDEDSHFKFIGSLSKDDLAISTKVSEAINAKEGDEISFTYGNTTYSGKVGLVYEAFVFNGVVTRADNPIYGSNGITSFQDAWVDLKDGADPETVKTAILRDHKYVMSAETQADWVTSIDDVMQGVLVMTNAVKVFAILLAIVVLYNLALMNFRQRSRDIATLKVLGFSRLEIASSLLIETLTLTLIGVLIGLALGYPFMEAVLLTNKVDLVEYLKTIYPISYVYSFLLTFVVAFFVNGFLSLRTKQVPMVESLKSVE